jgi:hypothetical protein
MIWVGPELARGQIRVVVHSAASKLGPYNALLCVRGRVSDFGCNAIDPGGRMIRTEEGNDHTGENNRGDEFEREVSFHIGIVDSCRKTRHTPMPVAVRRVIYRRKFGAFV